MIHPEDQSRLDEAKAAMEAALAPDQAAAIRKYRILENKALRRALTSLDEMLDKSPIKSRNRSIAHTELENVIMRLGKDLQECGETAYPNSLDTSNVIVDPPAPEVRKA